jgi:hypothetical protein
LSIGTVEDEFESKKSVSPTDALDMIKLSPIQRLESLRDNGDFVRARSAVGKLLEQYEGFLETTNVGESELVAHFMDKQLSRQYMESAYKFGDAMFEAMNQIGNGNRFHRLLVV